jgi:hypothetical protein
MFHISQHTRRAVFALACSAFVVGASSAEIIYVKADATGANDGTSWEDAFVHLQDALVVAGSGDQVWVAVGVYKPDQGQNQTPGVRTASFELYAGLALYGGFAGDEETLEERAGLFDDTVLSGDLAGDDLPDFVNREDNSYHVIFAETGSHTPFVVDGFRIIGGSTVESPGYDMGGGACVVLSTVEFRNCTFAESEAEYGGGAAIGDWSTDWVTASFDACRFEENRAIGVAGVGGGVWLSGECEGGFTGCTFRWNTAEEGGGLFVWIAATPPPLVFEGCVFEENAATSEFPLDGGGAICAERRFTATNCLFRANQAANGGAIYRYAGGNQTVLDDCAFEANIASNSEQLAHGGAVYLERGRFTIRNCVFTGNVAQIPPVDYNHAGGGAVSCKDVNFGLVMACTFEENSSSHDGGAVFNWSCSPWYVNCAFIANAGHGDADRFGGGAMFNNQNADARAVNCIFVGNSATGTAEWSGGGAVQNGISSQPTIANCTFVANTAASRGGGILSTWDSIPRVRNCILWNNTAGATEGELAQVDNDEADAASFLKYCCIEGWTGLLGDVGCFGDDPLFVDPLGDDGLPGTGDEDLRLGAGSPCIDRGSNWRVPFDAEDIDGDGDVEEYIPLDLDGEGRFFDDPNTPDNACGETAIVDLGAYEVGGTGPQPCYPDVSTDGSIDLADLACLLSVYGRHHAEPEFNPSCDLDVDGTIGLGDLAELLSRYGTNCP